MEEKWLGYGEGCVEKKEAELSEVENQSVTSLISVLSGSLHPFGTPELFPARVIECTLAKAGVYTARLGGQVIRGLCFSLR